MQFQRFVSWNKSKSQRICEKRSWNPPQSEHTTKWPHSDVKQFDPMEEPSTKRFRIEFFQKKKKKAHLSFHAVTVKSVHRIQQLIIVFISYFSLRFRMKNLENLFRRDSSSSVDGDIPWRCGEKESRGFIPLSIRGDVWWSQCAAAVAQPELPLWADMELKAWQMENGRRLLMPFDCQRGRRVVVALWWSWNASDEIQTREPVVKKRRLKILKTQFSPLSKSLMSKSEINRGINQ